MSDSRSSVAEISSLTEIRSHTLVEWKIENFLNLLNNNDKILDSPTFFLSRAEWFIRIYPNGCRSDDNGYISIFLHKKHSLSEYNVSHTFGLKISDDSILKTLFFDHNFKPEEDNWGRYKFYEKSKLIELKDAMATDGAVTISCGIYLKSNHVVEKAVQTAFSNSIETLSNNFKDLFDSEAEGDVTFRVNEAKFVAHKLVLGARSTVFQAMFNTDMLEKNSGIVDIEDSDPACFKDFLTYIYSGKLDAVSSDNALGLYLLAKKYNFQELKAACSEYMALQMSADSVCDVVHLASVHDEQELLEAATQFFVKHANVIFDTRKWFSFFTEHPTLANELLLKMAKAYVK